MSEEKIAFFSRQSRKIFVVSKSEIFVQNLFFYIGTIKMVKHLFEIIPFLIKGLVLILGFIKHTHEN